MAQGQRVRSPFLVLSRAFFLQFFTNESVTSDAHLRQTMLWVLAFLFVPGLFMMIMLFPEFAFAAIRVKFGRSPASHVDDLLAWIAFLFTTYSMVSVGFISVLAWDALAFDRRDAMVLGSLPLKHATILGAKLSALAALLLTASIPVNFLNAAVFALATSDQTGGTVLWRHFIALLCATVGAGVFAFAVIVVMRAAVGLLGGPRLASAFGPPLQFVFVVGLLSLVIFCPFVLHVAFASASFTNGLPSAWFAGLFERLRGSPRILDPHFPFLLLAHRALAITPMVMLGALVMSIAEFHRHMRMALAPHGSPGILGAAAVSRTIARLIVGRDYVARAITDFILLTLARNRSQQTPIAINAALGATVVIAGLSHNVGTIESLMHPRTAVLWIPLVMAYWMTVGLRASFFVPSELPASWAFRANAPERVAAHWSAVRASMLAFVLPRTLAITIVLAPFVGWRVTLWHAFIVCGLVVLLVEVIAVSIHHIPFTRAYEPGHAKLKTRWWVYACGLYVFAYWPTRLELSLLGNAAALLMVIACIALAASGFEIAGRLNASKRPMETGGEALDGLPTLAVLDLSGVIQRAGTGG